MPISDFPHHTVFRQTLVGLLDAEGNRIGTEPREAVYHVPGSDPEACCASLVTMLAEDDERMCDVDPDDEDYEFELMRAEDDVSGRFAVYAGILEARPDTPPLYEEGEIGEPTHWEARKPAA